MDVVRNAIKIDALTKDKLTAEMRRLTGLDNPNSVTQFTDWLLNRGVSTECLDKKAVRTLLKEVPDDISEVLRLRQQTSKTSVRKYEAMQNAVCKDGRARGMFQFYGAARSGRFSGRLIQLQNLPQCHMPDLDDARELVRQGDSISLSAIYDNVPNVLSELIRTAFVPRSGYKFVVADFSAIEARVLAWLAGEQWVLDTFAQGGDIYCATASKMYHCNVVKNGENGHLRQKGKQATLSCGYGGSVGALIAMGALESGMKEEELQPLVDAWRAANPNIVRFWYAVDSAAKECIQRKARTETNGIRFIYQSGMMFIELPSGRRLTYIRPRIGMNRYGSESVTYEGQGATKRWERIETFGGKLVENIVQGTARDILCYALKTLSYCSIVGHVHDEIIIEAEKSVSLDAICEQMGRVPPWANGLILRADGFEAAYYKKE